MFSPSQAEVRQFFFNVYTKAQNKQPLDSLEKIAYSIIMEHPEYHTYLQQQEKYIDYQWLPELGETNPFLHLSMHMTIIEQLSIDQPFGIKNLYQQLCNKFGDQHEASHQLMDCIAEMLWQAQRNKTQPDINTYFACIRQKLGIETNN